MMKCILLSNNNFDEQYCFDAMRRIIKPNMKVVCIPFASDLEWILSEIDGELSYNGKFRNEQYKPFREFGIEEGNFHMLIPTDNMEFSKWKLDKADIIYFSGGSMENIESVLKELDLWNYIINISKDKIFIGASAGALILQNIYHEVPFVDPNYTKYKRKKGLGFAKKICTLVHFDKENKKHIKNYHIVKRRTFRKKVIGLSDHSALIVIGNFVLPLGDVYIK